jgi:hypothetical protein
MNKIELPGFTLGVSGKYRITAVNEETGVERVLADWFPNLITNIGLDQLGGGGGEIDSCYVGTGSTAPAVTDTALVSQVGGAGAQYTATRTAQASPPYYGSLTVTYAFSPGAATGNLSEVGVGPSPTSLFSRALILDSLGSPTTITVLSVETLYVTYQLQTYVPTTDVTGTVVINAVTYSYVARAANATNASYWALYQHGDDGGFNSGTAFNGTIDASIVNQPSGSSVGLGSPSSASYSPGSYSITTTFNMALGDGNLAGGISAVLLYAGRSYGTMGSFQISISPPFPKDNTHVASLTFKHSWARYP